MSYSSVCIHHPDVVYHILVNDNLRLFQILFEDKSEQWVEDEWVNETIIDGIHSIPDFAFNVSGFSILNYIIECEIYIEEWENIISYVSKYQNLDGFKLFIDNPLYDFSDIGNELINDAIEK